MIKKIFLFIIAILLVSCGTGKPVASKSGKTVHRKPTTSVATRKPITEKPVVETKKAEENPVVSKPNSETVTLDAVTKVRVTTELVLGYINQYKETAQKNMKQYGIPSSIILAQGILESGAGTGPLSQRANNHFGIKCHKEWIGESVKHDDDSEQECFRKYNQPSESYRDHSLFLTSRSRYSSLFQLGKDDYKAWAKGLRAAGYATDVKYPDKLISIIERYQLNQYDSEVLGKTFVPSTILALTSSDSNSYRVNPGDTLYSISKKFNLTVEELKNKNNIQDNILSIGQNLKIK